MKRSIIAAISLLFLAVASVAEVSVERPVSEPAYGPAPGTRYGSAAASDGHDFLVAWIDSFRNPTNDKKVYAARMNAAGEVLDLLGIRLPTTSPQISRVDVVFLGNSYLVYWDEPISLNHNAIMGARISRDGLLLDSTPRILADGATVNIRGAASNGNRTVIAYITSGDSRMIVLDRDGNVVSGPRPFTSPNAPAASESSMVASNGNEFLVMSIRGAVLYPVRLDSNGDVTSTSAVSTMTATSLLDLASDGDGYVAITQAPTGVSAQHVSAAAQLLEKWPVPMQQLIPGFAFTGGSYLLMDGDPVAHTVGVRRLNHTGQPIGSYVAVSSAQALGGGATLASNGSDAGLFWTDWTTAVQSFLGALVNGQSLAASKTSQIARSANAQRAPNSATSGRNAAIVWNEDDGLYAGRISLDGQMLDGRGIRVGARSLSEPRIVYDGSNYLMAWTEQGPTSSTPPVDTVTLARLSPDSGALLDPSGIAVFAGQCVNGVTLAAGAASTLLAWSDCQHIITTTVDRDGSTAAAVTVTPAQTTNAGSVSAAWNGHEWLVVWEDEVPPAFSWDPPIAYDVRIFASRLSTSLTILDPSPVVLSNTLRDYGPQVASDGDGFLVVWTNNPSGDPSAYQVMAQRVSSDGSLLAQANGTHVASGTATSVVWDGAEYEAASSSSSLNGTVQTYTYTLNVAHIAAAGAIEGLRPLSLLTSAIEPHTSLVVIGTGRTATVYTRLGSEPLYGDVERAFVSLPKVTRGRAVR